MRNKSVMMKTLQLRDSYCWHCGTTVGLVPHHRKNRGMGGSKLLDISSNLMLVCAEYNFLMESDANVAMKARSWGHKLRSTDHPSEPVLDRTNHIWYELLPDGTKKEVKNAIDPGRSLLR